MNLFVGNLPFDLTPDDLREAFERYGTVTSYKIITERHGGASRGFGFVDMPNEREARAAIAGLHGRNLKGKAIVVADAARPPRGADAGE